MMDTEYLTVSKAAKIKQCSRTTIYHQMKQGRINTYEFAGKQFVIKDETFENIQINRGVPFGKMEERLAQLEEKVSQLEEENKGLEERVIELEGKKKRATKRGKKGSK